MTKNYIPYYYDALFYKIFGDEKDVSLLKIIIELSLDIEIDELTIVNGKILGDKHKMKKSYLDLDADGILDNLSEDCVVMRYYVLLNYNDKYCFQNAECNEHKTIFKRKYGYVSRT